jgi:hypothetical protein
VPVYVFDRGAKDPTSTTEARPLLWLRAAEMSRTIWHCLLLRSDLCTFGLLFRRNRVTKTYQDPML